MILTSEQLIEIIETWNVNWVNLDLDSACSSIILRKSDNLAEAHISYDNNKSSFIISVGVRDNGYYRTFLIMNKIPKDIYHKFIYLYESQLEVAIKEKKSKIFN